MEYLTSLREFHKTSGNNEQTVKVGDVVQVHDEIPRTKWKLAVVTELIRGNDGLVRSSRIRMNQLETTRLIVKLYPLELTFDIVPNRADINEHSSDEIHLIQNFKLH